ncbi:unnamed protein product [Paramecium sonneborni]|uniref:SSD domain-containing protein n=1 Tax=Paramecium sonneborni TaxID=65129 RepID=A0A8S1K7R0_9CILI|nr:unnamed protein product [Paramecium sonneborni]
MQGNFILKLFLRDVIKQIFKLWAQFQNQMSILEKACLNGYQKPFDNNHNMNNKIFQINLSNLNQTPHNHIQFERKAKQIKRKERRCHMERKRKKQNNMWCRFFFCIFLFFMVIFSFFLQINIFSSFIFLLVFLFSKLQFLVDIILENQSFQNYYYNVFNNIKLLKLKGVARFKNKKQT